MVDLIDDYEFLICGECGIRWGMPRRFVEVRRAGGEACTPRSFYCPNGHVRVFRETDNDKLRRERDRLKQDAARLEEERNAAWQAEQRAVEARRKAESELKRTVSRAGGGVCPCCNRTFSQLARHMANKHPEIVPIAKKRAANG